MGSLKSFKEATDTNINYLLKCADFLYKQKKFEAAEEIYKSVLQKEMKNEPAIKGLGSCLYFLKKYEQAFRCFQGLEKLFKNESAKAWCYATLIRLGKTKEAKEYVKECSDINGLVKSEGIELDYY